ncbi:RidA family protein [Anaeroselena agilis]|uniref:RidA family protein n=1 Tax=Anaeroselena agilis TaxID=3063788 RepID=A0ABU3P3P5_9FIRM|nr:RidA family protein [Selenomonadales bacterium 4137-cl]
MKTIVATDQAPQAIGPYSQAVKANGFLFLSGQVPLDPVTGQLVYGGVAMQTRQSLSNLQAVLAKEGLTLANVVKTTVFLQDMNDFAEMNKVYAEFFPSEPPARSTVQVARLPKDALVEIEAVAAY